MPGPPTPLSGCPLKRLEIHDRLADRFYDAAQTAAALTLTLEAQRSSIQDGNDLVLQVHCGLQRMLSFQLTGLLNSPNGEKDAVSIERALQQLCVNSQQHDQKILATFEEARDFNVAACMLKKFGFQVKDGIPKPNTLTNSGPPAPAFGPRLSSITSLPCPGPIGRPQYGSDLSFASILNSEFPLSHSGQFYNHLSTASSPVSSPMQSQFGPSSPSYHCPLSNNQHAVLQTMSQPVYSSFLNPYHVFLGRQLTHPHQPLVGSPLRQSLNVGEANVPMTTSFEQPVYSEQSRFRLIQDGRSISAPIISPKSQGFQEIRHLENGFGPRGPDMNPQAASQSGNPDELSRRSNGSITFDQLQFDMKEDIHELMPRPRKLPFAKQGKGALGPKKASKPAPASEASPKEKPKKQLKGQSKKAPKEVPEEVPEKVSEKIRGRARKNPKGESKEVPEKKIKERLKKNSKEESKEDAESKPKGKSIKRLNESLQESPSAKPAAKRVRKVSTPSGQVSKPRPQKRDREELVRPTTVDKSTEEAPPKSRRRTKAPFTHHQVEPPPSAQDSPEASPSEPTRVPTMLLTDHDVLRKVNEATSKLLQQYENDIARGCEDGTYAKFYAERIHSVRRDFWLAQLMGAESEKTFNLMSEASVVTV